MLRNGTLALRAGRIAVLRGLGTKERASAPGGAGGREQAKIEHHAPDEGLGGLGGVTTVTMVPMIPR
jgi:hypothetical protein